MEPLTNAQRRAVLCEFLDRMEDRKSLLPDSKPLPYNPVPAITTVAWSIFIAQEMVAGELTELTNQMNHWMGGLQRWHAWNEVLAKHNPKFAGRSSWNGSSRWPSTVCSSRVQRATASPMVATNALHQIRMARDPTVKDELLR